MTDTLPKMKIVNAIVTGCGGSGEDRQRFASAWRAIRGGRPAGETGTPDRQPRHLHPVPSTRDHLA